MKMLILIAGGAIAMAATPAQAGGQRPSMLGQVLQCLTCPGSGSGTGAPIVAGNLAASANVKAHVSAPGLATAAGLHVNTKAKAWGNGGNTGLAAALNAKARANLPSVRLGNGDCK